MKQTRGKQKLKITLQLSRFGSVRFALKRGIDHSECAVEIVARGRLFVLLYFPLNGIEAIDVTFVIKLRFLEHTIETK